MICDAVNAVGERAVVKKAAARSAGMKKYFTGRACKNGHVTERWVSCGSCMGCQQVTKVKLKDHAVAYQREWLKANRDKSRAYTAKWREKNPDAGADYMARKRSTDRATLLAQERDRYARDPEKFLAKTRAYFASNPGLMAAYARNRRARKATAEGAHSAEEVAALAVTQRRRCANCRGSIKRGYHADHIKPLVLGGSNWIRNIQLLCPPCNMKKGPKDPIAFAQLQGRLV